jgi:hypothetical protein
MESLQGASFLMIRNLGKPDALLPFGINFLPILMTVINCVSGAVYTKGFPGKEKIQLYGMAAVFLVLLYNSPAGLVLYWTLNNVFSLVKNILQKAKHTKRIVYLFLVVSVLLLDVYVLFFHGGYLLKRIVVVCATSFVFFLPLLKKGISLLPRKFPVLKNWKTRSLASFPVFLFSALTLFLLAGLVIPAALINSSVDEFSFVSPYTSPFPFIAQTLLQVSGFFIFWVFILYFLFSKVIKAWITMILFVLCLLTLANTFLFSGDYGFLTNTLILSNPGSIFSNPPFVILNLFANFVVIFCSVFLLFSKRSIIIHGIQIVILISLIGFGVISSVQIGQQFSRLKDIGETEQKELTPIYHLSKTNKNVVIIMLDRAISAFVPYLFAEKSEIAAAFTGFTWYPNCVSFGPFTLFGVPPLFGGYEYTPLAMQENHEGTQKPLAEKHNEALLLLPRIFLEQAHFSRVTITDPSWANYAFTPDLRIFAPYSAIDAYNINNAYLSYYLQNHPDLTTISVADLLRENLSRFSFFKMSPAILRVFIYDRGDWLRVNDRDAREERQELTQVMLGKYAALFYLPSLTQIDLEPESTGGKLNIIVNEITHDPTFLQAPDYVPVQMVTNRGTGKFANEAHYHVDMASFLLLAQWFNFLKAEGIYDNTRIIIAADHGWSIPDIFPDVLPDGSLISSYNPLLMVKNFDAEGEFNTDNTFMTQADVPLLALQGIIDEPINPFTGRALVNDKDGGATITVSNRFYPTHHSKYRFNINADEWFHVHDNIFDVENWEKVEK